MPGHLQEFKQEILWPWGRRNLVPFTYMRYIAKAVFFFFFSLLSINNVKNCFSNAFQQKYEKTVLYVRVLSSNMTIKKHHPFSVWCIFKFEVFLTNYYLIYRKILGKCLFLRQKINIKFGYVLLPVKSLIILMHCYTYMIYV